MHGSSITASITITIIDSYTFTWNRLIITLQQNMEHASCSQIIVASLLMLKVQMHFAFAVDNFHTVDCAVIYNLPSVIIQFTRGRVPVRVITLARQSSVSAAHLTPPPDSIEHNIGVLRPKYLPANRRFLGSKKGAKKSNADLGHILQLRDRTITPILLEV